MPIAVTIKHGETVYHDGMVDALLDYMDCADERDVEMWWESELWAEYWALNTKDEWTDVEHARAVELRELIKKEKENQYG